MAYAARDRIVVGGPEVPSARIDGGLLAPKGRAMKAQGVALGNRPGTALPSPERGALRVCGGNATGSAPFQGLRPPGCRSPRAAPVGYRSAPLRG